MRELLAKLDEKSGDPTVVSLTNGVSKEDRAEITKIYIELLKLRATIRGRVAVVTAITGMATTVGLLILGPLGSRKELTLPPVPPPAAKRGELLQRQ